MSNLNYINDILKSLELNSINGIFFPMPYPDSDSCFRYECKPNGSIIKYVNIVSSSINKPCPHCGCIDCHDYQKNFSYPYFKWSFNNQA